MLDRKRLLHDLGSRLRAARERRGLAVSDLARQAGISRRHVTEAEAGRANLTVVKLADLALTLGVGLEELCRLPPSRPGERIALVGLRGAGKSTLGRRLALELEVPFVELDQRVEEAAGMSLSELFALHGEAGFERLEGEALERVLAGGERCVLAAGGSIVSHARNFERLLATCRTVWLRARPAEHFQRVLDQGDRRPMEARPRAMAELEELLARRAPLYARAEIALSTSDRPVEAALKDLRAALGLAP